MDLTIFPVIPAIYIERKVLIIKNADKLTKVKHSLLKSFGIEIFNKGHKSLKNYLST
jgi:hypothetical protein